MNKETKFFQSKIKGIQNNHSRLSQINDLSNSNFNLNNEIIKSELNDVFLDITPVPQESLKNNDMNDEQALNENDLLVKMIYKF